MVTVPEPWQNPPDSAVGFPGVMAGVPDDLWHKARVALAFSSVRTVGDILTVRDDGCSPLCRVPVGDFALGGCGTTDRGGSWMVARPTKWPELNASDGPVGKGAGLVRTDDGAELTTGDGPLDGWTDDAEYEGTFARLGDGVL